MSRYLVLAHETVASQTLIERVVALHREDPTSEFVLVVPATPVKHLLRRHAGADAGVAAARAKEGQAAFTAAGVAFSEARVGAAEPLQVVTDEIASGARYDAVIISTLPEEQSRWLRMELSDQVQRAHDLPVILVQASIADLDRMRQLP